MKIERVRRRLVEQAIAENLEIIRGLPPRGLRPRRFLDRWVRRAPLVLVPLTVLASAYLVANAPTGVAAPAALPPAVPRTAAPPPPVLEPTPARTYEFVPHRVAAAAFPLSVRRVVLDAGHGGSDPGATASSVTEKEVTLDIGRRLRRRLEASGFDVVVTRTEDRTIPLRERARMANSSRGDIFVSIHVNTITKHTSSRGVETYYLGPTNDPSLTRLAAAENIGSGYSLADLRKLLDGVYADARSDESQQLAAAVQHQLYGRLRGVHAGLENWGVKRAPFVVLVATDMPAILTEVGCLSNAKEAAMLGEPEYRQQIAEALFHGIQAYATANESPQKKGT